MFVSLAQITFFATPSLISKNCSSVFFKYSFILVPIKFGLKSLVNFIWFVFIDIIKVKLKSIIKGITYLKIILKTP